MKFTIDNATDSPEINRLAQFVFDAVKPEGHQRVVMRVALTGGETLGHNVFSATNFAELHSVTVPRELVADAVKSAERFGEPVPEYAMPFVKPYI